jgi:hypothetical protein
MNAQFVLYLDDLTYDIAEILGLIHPRPGVSSKARPTSASHALYRRIVEDALYYWEQEDIRLLWRDPKLKEALDWKAKTNPNQAWAYFYDDPKKPMLDLALDFLEKGEAQRQKEHALQERDQQAQMLRARTLNRLAWAANVLIFLYIVVTCSRG